MSTRLVASPAPRLRGVERVAAGLACLFAAELVLGGPGYWMVGGISIRKLLFVLNMLWFGGMWTTGALRLRRSEIMLALGLLLLMGFWILLIPAVYAPSRLGLAIQDGQPIATALLGLLYFAFFRDRSDAWQRFCRVIATCLVLVAMLNIGLWLLGMSGEAGNFAAQAAALFFFTLGRLDLDPPLYVGLMPDGFFRAMWITGTLYLPALLYCIATRRKAGILLFGAALLATYTRSLWLATAIAIVIAQWLSHRRHPFIDGRLFAYAIGAALLGSVAYLLWSANAAEDGLLSLFTNRLGTTFSDASAEERFEQVQPLIQAWLQAPLLGNGFGASASLVRSDEAPFSYEMTVLAMLMKTGVIGLMGVAIITLSPWMAGLPAKGIRSRTTCAGLGAVIAFLAASATNPFLINFVGMSTLAFMYARLHLERQPSLAHDLPHTKGHLLPR